MEDIRSQRNGFVSRIRHAFRERQVYLRSDGQVQFITLRPWVQAVFAAGFVAALFWFSFATVNITFKDQIIAAKERRALQLQIAYEDRLAALQTIVDKINDRLMLDQNAYVAKVEDLRAIQKELEDRHKLLSEVIKRGWSPPAQRTKPERDDLSDLSVGAHDGDPYELAAADGAADETRAQPQTQEDWRAPERPFRTRAEAAKPIVKLGARIDALGKKQDTLLDRIERDRRSQMEKISGTLSKLGLAPGKIAAARNGDDEEATGNIGGPFVSLRSVWPEDRETQEQILRIDRHIRNIERLRQAVREMPIGRPLNRRHRITSSYGVRRDPLRKTLAVHYGIDFKGRTGDKVLSAADGTVTYARSRAGYGNLIEVRHDNGISTRYAHLSRIDVKVGDKVSRFDPIGRIGNTGRSTGPHLHYEILVFGKPVDPRRLWRAGENVLKAQNN